MYNGEFTIIFTNVGIVMEIIFSITTAYFLF